VLIVIGLVALLFNVGLITPDQLARLVTLWPLVLVALGLVLIFRAWLPQFTVPITIVVAAVVLAAAAFYAAVPSAFPVVGGVGTQRSDSSTPLSQSVSRGELDLGLGAGTATVSAGNASDLYRAHLDYQGAAPRVSAEGGTVRIESGGDGLAIFRQGRTNVRVELNTSIPWDVHVGGGASRGTLDLAEVKVSSLEISGGANQIEATLPQPSDRVRVQVSGGASSVTIHRPTGVPVRVHMSGGASNLTVDGRHFSVIGGDQGYQSGDFDTATARYDVEISGGASNVTINAR
jgi:hypothetical protein